MCKRKHHRQLAEQPLPNLATSPQPAREGDGEARLARPVFSAFQPITEAL
eukprot:SAG11_NODE_27712_length_330_cov_0.432900_2_plen_49_part_01